MKKITLFFTVFLFLGINVFAQNPFDAKKKIPSTKSFIPSPLANFPQIKSSQVSDFNPNFHSIPFMPMGLNSNSVFKAFQFNKKGQVIFLQGNKENALQYSQNSKSSIELAALEYLSNIKSILKIENPQEEFELVEFHTDNYGLTHVKLQQYYQGLKVYRGQVFVHGKNQQMMKFNGEYFPTPKLTDLTPDISVEEAAQISKGNIEVPFIEPSDFEKAILNYEEIVSELVIYHPSFESTSANLCWHLTVRPNFLRRFEYFIDAKTGEILNHYNHTCSDGPATANATDLNGQTQTIHTYSLSGNYYLLDASRAMFNAGQSNLPNEPVGAIVTINANNTSGSNMNLTHYTSASNSWNSVPEAVSAHFNAGEAYEYYKTTHNRNSLNGQGGTIYSICNVTDENGNSMENAYWNGQAMFYGNGGSTFSSLAGALDVGAHELGHGVVSNTCNLEYQGESGALNEAMADISGCMVDREDWHLGEDVIIDNSSFPTGFLRDMSNPHNGGSALGQACYQPAHLTEKYTGSGDNGGVHINSGIMNFAYYKFATAMNSKEKAESIWYKSMTDYLVKSSQFADARVAFVQSATDIFGASSSETNAVKDAFAAVGIGEGSGGGGGGGTPGQNDLEVNPGQDYILSVDVNDADPNSLYVSSTVGSDFVAVSQTGLYQKPSIVDNGSVAVFVTEDKKIKSLLLTSPYTESDIATDAVYDNISVSKDGKRIAIVTTSIDSAIWVYDFNINGGEWKKFHLFNPTFTPGVVTENVLYADALEWDNSGQYIIYDAYNDMDEFDYWDMGVIRVWNNGANTWGDGKIEKVFSSLPEGTSVGNPSLAMNSPYILAFDFFDNNTGEAKVMAANLQTGESAILFENTILGYPNYSKNDDKVIFSAQDNNGDEIIGQIGLQANKIEPSGEATGLIGMAKWGIWYATGSRNVYAVEEQIQDNFFTFYPNPVNNSIHIVFSNPLGEKSNLKVFNLMGQLVLEKKLLKNDLLINIDISNLSLGNYFIQWNDSKTTIIKKFVKM